MTCNRRLPAWRRKSIVALVGVCAGLMAGAVSPLAATAPVTLSDVADQAMAGGVLGATQPVAAPPASASPIGRAAATAPPPASAYVVSSGGQLWLQGHPWRFTGYDDYRLPSASPGFQCGGAMSDTDVSAAITQMRQSSNAAVIRTWFFQSYGGPGNWSQLDRVVNAATAAGVKLIPVLVNQWADCEPWPGGVRPYRNLSWYQSGYRSAGDGYPMSFRDYAAAVAAHYRGNSTIAFWQLVNEAEALDSLGGTCEESAANSAMRAFADDMAGVVKGADPSHLVSLGTIGTGQCGTQGVTDYINLHAGAIDICEYHDYASGALSGDQWNGIATRLNACASLGKPIFAGEVGIDASVNSAWLATGTVSASSLQQRAAFFQQKMTAQFGLGLSGFLVWEKSPQPSTGLEIGPGDPLEAVMAAQERSVNPWYGGGVPRHPG